MPLSFSFKPKTSTSTTPTAQPSKRAAVPSKLSSALTPADDDHEEESAPKQHQITTFGDGAEDVDTKEVRVIPRLENDANGVMGRKRRREDDTNDTGANKKNGAVNSNAAINENELDGQRTLGYGLTLVQRSSESDRAPEANTSVDASANASASTIPSTANGQNGTTEKKEEEETLDAKALRALQGEDVGLQTNSRITPPTEDEVFSRHFSHAPDPGTLQDYDLTPVEGFGAAILRGYLKQGEKLEDRIAAHQRGETVKEVKSRPGLLGLGAKDAGGISGVELGAWGAKRGKDAVGYNPLARKNKVTGEVLSEAELKQKLDSQKREGTDRERDWKERKRVDGVAPRSRRDEGYDGDRSRGHEGYGDRSRRDEGYSDRSRRNEDHDSDRKDKRRDRRDEPSSSSRRDRSRDDHRSSRRHRSRSTDSRDRRRRDEYSGDEYRSRKHRDRDRRERSRERYRD